MSAAWFRDDEPVPDCEYYAYVSGDDGGTFALSMTDPFVADTGTYSCKVINTFGEAVSQGQLVVNGAYDITLLYVVKYILLCKKGFFLLCVQTNVPKFTNNSLIGNNNNSSQIII